MKYLVALAAGCLVACTTIPKGTPVADEMLKPEYMKNFGSTVCLLKETDKVTEKQQIDCEWKFFDAYIARLNDRYPYVTNAVWNKCQAYPIECKDHKKFEEWAKEDSYRNEQKRDAERNIIRAQILSNALKEMPQQRAAPITCQSSANLFGGYNITCP
jgi:hypothetical protein